MEAQNRQELVPLALTCDLWTDVCPDQRMEVQERSCLTFHTPAVSAAFSKQPRYPHAESAVPAVPAACRKKGMHYQCPALRNGC